MLNLRARILSALRWSEQYTQTDMLYLTKGGFWLALGHGVQLISGLILAVAFANLLPKDAYGTYQFVMSLAAVISALTLSGMSTAITRAVARGNDGALPYGFRLQMTWSIGIVLAGGALSLYYFLNGDTTLGTSLLIVGALSPFVEGFGLYRHFLIGKKYFQEATMLGMWRKPLPVVALLLALLFTDNPVILLFIYFSSNALSGALLYMLVVRTYKLKAVPDNELKSIGKHLSILEIITRLTTNADKILVFHFLGAAPVAAYALAQLPVKQLQNALGLSGMLILPKLSEKKFSDIKRTLPHKVRVFLLFALVIVAVYVLLAPFLFAFLFPAYPEAILPTQLLSLLILSTPRSLYLQAFMADNATRELYIIQISSAVLRLTLLLILLPLYGLLGAVLTVLSVHLFANILIRYLFHRAKPHISPVQE